MRMLALLPALLFVAAPAAACSFGFRGHTHGPIQLQAAPGAPSAVPAGRCAELEPVAFPEGGTPLNLRTVSIPAEDLPLWASLGYVPRDGRLVDGVGRPLTQEAYAFLLQPWSSREERLHAQVWMYLMIDNARLDEGTCHITDGIDGRTLPRVYIAAVKSDSARYFLQSSLERILGLLHNRSPNQRLPPEARAVAAQARAAGFPLPAELQAIFDRPGATVGDFRGPAQTTYIGLLDYFDGAMTRRELASAVAPTDARVGDARPNYFNSQEQRLGEALWGGYRQQFSRNSVGASLLQRLTDQRQGMPRLLLLKLSQRPEDSEANALYHADTDTVIIDHWFVAGQILRRASPHERDALQAILSDGPRLTAYLLERPAMMAEVVAETESAVFHEFVHAHQARRSRMAVEISRGNLPDVNPLTNEHEAYREQCRYIFAKASYDPAAVDRDAFRDGCGVLLRDPERFADAITESYLNSLGGVANSAELLGLQQVRIAALRSEDAVSRRTLLARGLRLLGVVRAAPLIEAFNADTLARERSFLEELPPFRAEVAGLMSAAMVDAPARSLDYLTLDPQWATRREARERIQAAMDWVTTDTQTPGSLMQRVQVVQFYVVYLEATAGRMEDRYSEAAVLTYGQYAQAKLLEAQSLQGPERAAALDVALAFATAIQDADLARSITAARTQP